MTLEGGEKRKQVFEPEQKYLLFVLGKQKWKFPSHSLGLALLHLLFFTS